MATLRVASELEKNTPILEGIVELQTIKEVHLAYVIQALGVKNVMDLMNAQLPDRFNVDFGFGEVEKTLVEENYQGLALFYHELVIPKLPELEAHLLVFEKGMEESFEIMNSREDEVSRTYTVYLGEGPFATSLGEACWSMTHRLIPSVEHCMQKLQVTEYQMKFLIDIAY